MDKELIVIHDLKITKFKGGHAQLHSQHPSDFIPTTDENDEHKMELVQTLTETVKGRSYVCYFKDDKGKLTKTLDVVIALDEKTRQLLEIPLEEVEHLEAELKATSSSLHKADIENYELKDQLLTQQVKHDQFKNTPFRTRLLWVFTGVKV